MALLTFNLQAKNRFDAVYVCLPDQSNGFTYRNGSWQKTSFKIRDSKYLIRRLKDDSIFIKNYTHGVFRVGYNDPAFICKVKILSNPYRCRSSVSTGGFVFSPSDGQFIATDTSGFSEKRRKNKSASMIIGKCSML